MTTERIDVLAMRWFAELSVSPNGLHQIRAGAVNERERPLVGYAATYELAKGIADEHNRSAAVAELIEAHGQLIGVVDELLNQAGYGRVVFHDTASQAAVAALEASFTLLGRLGGNTIDSPFRKDWEAARAALARMEPQS